MEQGRQVPGQGCEHLPPAALAEVVQAYHRHLRVRAPAQPQLYVQRVRRGGLPRPDATRHASESDGRAGDGGCDGGEAGEWIAQRVRGVPQVEAAADGQDRVRHREGWGVRRVRCRGRHHFPRRRGLRGGSGGQPQRQRRADGPIRNERVGASQGGGGRPGQQVAATGRGYNARGGLISRAAALGPDASACATRTRRSALRRTHAPRHVPGGRRSNRARVPVEHGAGGCL
mmetsp:Transcript_33078/g.106999  ORF Transcript_33078/g.106999 Transcript_33078/m.106999 type:complete len:230 (-) Transcript_33078:479-1168(-)